MEAIFVARATRTEKPDWLFLLAAVCGFNGAVRGVSAGHETPGRLVRRIILGSRGKRDAASRPDETEACDA
jgi:hypothetical protein